MRKYRLLFIGSLLLGIMVIVLTGSRFWFEDGLLGSETLERLRSALPGATVIDRAESYRAHKDLNESLRPSAKVSRTPRRRGRKL